MALATGLGEFRFLALRPTRARTSQIVRLRLCVALVSVIVVEFVFCQPVASAIG